MAKDGENEDRLCLLKNREAVRFGDAAGFLVALERFTNLGASDGHRFLVEVWDICRGASTQFSDGTSEKFFRRFRNQDGSVNETLRATVLAAGKWMQEEGEESFILDSPYLNPDDQLAYMEYRKQFNVTRDGIVQHLSESILEVAEKIDFEDNRSTTLTSGAVVAVETAKETMTYLDLLLRGSSFLRPEE